MYWVLHVNSFISKWVAVVALLDDLPFPLASRTLWVKQRDSLRKQKVLLPLLIAKICSLKLLRLSTVTWFWPYFSVAYQFEHPLNQTDSLFTESQWFRCLWSCWRLCHTLSHWTMDTIIVLMALWTSSLFSKLESFNLPSSYTFSER